MFRLVQRRAPHDELIDLLWPYLAPSYRSFGGLRAAATPAIRLLLPDYTGWKAMFGAEPPWIRRLVAVGRWFEVLAGPRVVLRYAPEVKQFWFPELALKLCEQELEWLTKRFEFSLRQPVTVFLMARTRAYQSIFRDHFGGRALPAANVIVLSDESWLLTESIRHELVHLFTASWNEDAPPLLNEGLAVALQGRCDGRLLDHVPNYIFKDRRLKLAAMVDPQYFYEKNRCRGCYALAGSFTGFLLRRFGWSCFRELFIHSTKEGFRAQFKQRLGLALEEAEAAWREEVVLVREFRFAL
jgi:hypothetical protein